MPCVEKVCGAKLLSLNCHSLRNKVHDVMEAVTLLDVDLFFVQETWLMKSVAAILQVIREYG